LSAASSRAELLRDISRAAISIARPEVGRFGVAVPGPFDYAAGVSQIEHKLRALYGVDLRSSLCEVLQIRDATAVRFLNDADAFVLGEWWAGAARSHARTAGITLGTGLGAAFLAEGAIVRTWAGIPAGGALWEQSFRGAPVEQTISSGAVAASYPRGAVACEEIAARANAGEPSARRVFEQLGDALAEFLTPWLRSFEPTCLVVGGSIAHSWDLFAPALRSGLETIASIRSVVVAEQLVDAPLLGAAWYAAGDGR
jgi:glucokinase